MNVVIEGLEVPIEEWDSFSERCCNKNKVPVQEIEEFFIERAHRWLGNEREDYAVVQGYRVPIKIWDEYREFCREKRVLPSIHTDGLYNWYTNTER